MSAPVIETLNGEKVLAMTRGSLVRKPSCLVGGWTRIRVGVRLTFQDIGGTLHGALWMGLCSGNTNVFGDKVLTHFVGAWMSAGNDDILRTAGPPIRYGLSWSYINACKSVSSAANIYANAGDIEGTDTGIGVDGLLRTCYFLDFIKVGVNNWTTEIYRDVDPPAADISAATFAAGVALTLPGIANHSVSTAANLAADEASWGTLDHVNLYWGGNSKLYISDLAVVRLS